MDLGSDSELEDNGHVPVSDGEDFEIGIFLMMQPESVTFRNSSHRVTLWLMQHDKGGR